jgi:hypothetical protein
MPKISYKERFLSFKDCKCPYCGGNASLEIREDKTFFGQCRNPKCGAHNNFTNEKCNDW